MKINFEFEELKKILKEQNTRLVVVNENLEVKYIDKKIKDYFSAEKEPIKKADIERFFEEKNIDIEKVKNEKNKDNKFSVKNGKEEYKVGFINNIEFDNELCSVIIISDISSVFHGSKEYQQMLLQLQVVDELVENAYEGMVIVDADGIITNCKYEKLLGIKEKDVIGKNVSDVIENTRLQDVIKSGLKEIGDIQVINGHEMLASRIPIIRDNKVIGAVGTVLFKDIEELKYLAKRVGNEASSNRITKEEKKKIDQAKYSFENIITQNSQMLSLMDLAKKASETNSTVLIYGESGTGKEYFSHAIHLNSKRKYGPFVRINCAAIPKELLESELFGYDEGAFTGAKKSGKIGKFEYANGGTIFLDEIGTMPLDMQAKLLRVLEEREFERVGGNKKIDLDIRVIAATNDSLPDLVTKGKFREDLFYRLNVINITIPPLRNRLDDIQILSESMLEMFSKYYKNAPKKISNGALELLKKYRWPGNIRELRNVIERSVTVSNGDMIFLKDLPEFISNISPDRKKIKETYPTLKEMVVEVEIKAIKDAIVYCDGNKSEAAKMLGIHRTALYKKCEKIGIEL